MANSDQPTSGDKKDYWDAEAYTKKAAPFVPQLTSRIVSWLDPQPSDTILDIGCGDGLLTSALSTKCTSITGLDASENLIAHLHNTYPALSAHVLDCSTSLSPPPPFLAASSFSKIFSNAALHWILRAPSSRLQFFSGCRELLRPGGVLVSESGAFGNVAECHACLVQALMHHGVSPRKARDASPWFFPTMEEMRGCVEGAGLVWVKGEVELRQTLLTEGEEGGVRGWVRLFGAPFKEVLEGEEEWTEVVEEVVQALEGVGRRVDGGFMVNYVRLRFVARREE
ncbi:MAG: hypothetical protein MMC23_002954 [Stictis urceolatum]|nr:hypothetical protein [Stictis urceolata]